MAEDSPGSMGRVDMIFLDKRNSNLTNDWAYYRVTSIIGADIEVCRVTFPECKDMDTPIVTPGNVGLAAAFDNIKKLLWNQWQITHDTDNLIGLLFHRH